MTNSATTPLTLTTEARAWLEANKGWSTGIATEIVGLKLQGVDPLKAYKTGHKHVANSCPNTFRPWYRDGHTTKIGAGAPLGQLVIGLSKDGADNKPTIGNNTEYRTPLRFFYADEELPAFVTAPVYTQAPQVLNQGRNARIEAKADSKTLNDTTWTVYNAKTKSLWAAKGIHSSRKYQIKVQQLDKQLKAAIANNDRRRTGVQVRQADVQATDTSFVSAQNLLALVEVLQQTLTPRQLELIEDKAFGTPVRGSSYKQLQAARAKAQVALKSLLTNR